jgi:hypothetical protein
MDVVEYTSDSKRSSDETSEGQDTLTPTSQKKQKVEEQG